MTISIIIPIYNVAPYIEQCLRSVFAQTYQDEVECLLVDDCGADESMEIAEQLIRDYHGAITFRILHHEHNRGLSAARNTGVKAARGEYICFMDSDDWATTDMLVRLASAMQSTEEGVGMVVGFFYHNLKDETYVENPFDWHREHSYVIEPSDFALSQLGLRIPHEAWGRLIRRDLLLEVPFREGRKIEDRLWVLDATPVVEHRGIRMLVIPDYIYYYRRRKGSILHSDVLQTTNEELKVSNEIMTQMRETHPDVWDNERRHYLWTLSAMVKEASIDTHSWRVFLSYYTQLIQTNDEEAQRLLPPGVMILYRKMKYQGLLVWLKHRF